MKFFLSVALCLFSVCSFAQNAAVQQAAKAASLSGTLTKYGSGEPLRNAEISVNRVSDTSPASDESTSNQVSVVTDAAGRFRFPSLVPGDYTIVVRKNGFHGFRGPNSHTWQEFLNITLSPGQAVNDLALAMQPGSVISGRVLDEDGEPIAYVQVSALKWVYANHRRQLRPVGVGNTDDQGSYRIFSLEPGRYIVRANVIQDGGNSKLHYAPSYFPESSSPTEASPIALRPGDQAQADFRMSRVPSVKVTGHINGTTSGAQTQVYLRNAHDEGASIQRSAGATMDHNGNFTLEGVLPGDYTISALEFRGDNNDNPLHAEAPIHVDGTDLPNISLTLDEGGRSALQGTLTVDTPNVQHPRLDTLRIGLLPVDDTNNEFAGNGGYSAIGPNGAIRLDRIVPGKYVVSLTAEGSGWEDFYTKSVTIAGRDVTDAVVNISSSRGVVPITVTAGTDGAFVEGSVTDDEGKPVANAIVIGVPDPALRAQFDLYQRGETDQNGHFRLRGIKPGAYSFFAWSSMDDESYMDPDFLRAFENSRVDQSLAPNSHQKVELKLLSPDDAQ